MSYDLILPAGADMLARIYLLALCIWREARGEPMEGKVAVACVIANRAARPRWWGKSIEDVILKPKQFSSFNADDANSVAFPRPEDKSWLACVEAAVKVLRGETADVTGGADHYKTIASKPAWAADKLPVVVIGNHEFFRLEA